MLHTCVSFGSSWTFLLRSADEATPHQGKGSFNLRPIVSLHSGSLHLKRKAKQPVQAGSEMAAALSEVTISGDATWPKCVVCFIVKAPFFLAPIVRKRALNARPPHGKSHSCSFYTRFHRVCCHRPRGGFEGFVGGGGVSGKVFGGVSGGGGGGWGGVTVQDNLRVCRRHVDRSSRSLDIRGSYT